MTQFDKEDVVRWIAGSLEDPKKSLAIETNLQEGDRGVVAPWLEQIAENTRRIQAMRTSGELGRRLAQWRRSSAENSQVVSDVPLHPQPSERTWEETEQQRRQARDRTPD